jgi:hypothetical protein
MLSEIGKGAIRVRMWVTAMVPGVVGIRAMPTQTAHANVGRP